MDKYGVKIDVLSFIISLRYFSPTETIPSEYIQISKEVYEECILYLKPWSKFQNGKIFNGGPEEAAWNTQNIINTLRTEMKELQAEITSNTYLGEPITELETQLAAKKAEYEALITPP